MSFYSFYLFFPNLLATSFEKFLVDKQGNVVNRYSSMAKPSDIGNDVEKLL